jgi:hypothetical protein
MVSNLAVFRLATYLATFKKLAIFSKSFGHPDCRIVTAPTLNTNLKRRDGLGEIVLAVVANGLGGGGSLVG